MIYHNGKRYVLMKNGRPYEEAYSSLTPAQLSEIKTYMETHEGETLIAENGVDWVFKFEPFPEKIIRYLKKGGHRLHLRYAYRGKSSAYGMAWFDKNNKIIKDVDTYDRHTFNKMAIPAVNKWIGNIGYCTVWCSPVNGNEGDYPIAVRVTPKDLRRGEITLPGVESFHNLHCRAWWLPLIAKLSLVFDPQHIYTHKKRIDEDSLTPINETAIMESKTVVTKNRNGLDRYKEQNNPWVTLPNSVYAGGTRTKEHTVTIIRNDLYDNDMADHGWMVVNAGGSTPRNNSDSDLINYESGVLLNVNSLKFQIYSTYHCRVRIRSISMGWDFITPDEPAYPSNGSGGSTYITPTIGVTQDIDDLEIILYS